MKAHGVQNRIEVSRYNSLRTPGDPSLRSGGRRGGIEEEGRFAAF
jgi:hypothetical protein